MDDVYSANIDGTDPVNLLNSPDSWVRHRAPPVLEGYGAMVPQVVLMLGGVIGAVCSLLERKRTTD